MCPIDFDWQIVRAILQEETKDVREVYIRMQSLKYRQYCRNTFSFAPFAIPSSLLFPVMFASFAAASESVNGVFIEEIK